jgi:hypothetical protein
MREIRYETTSNDRTLKIKRIKVCKTGARYDDIVDELEIEEERDGSFSVYMDHSDGDPDDNRWADITIRREDALMLFEWLATKEGGARSA